MRMSGRRLALVLLVSGLAGLRPTQARAQVEMEPGASPGSAAGSASTPDPDAGEPAAPVKDPRLAKKLVAAGAQLVQKGDSAQRKNKLDDARTFYAQGAVAFQKAIVAGDDLNVYYDLAVTEEKLGKLDLAAGHLRTLLAAKAGKAGVKADIMKKAQTKFDDLAMKIGFVTLTVDPAGTTVSVAGVQVGKSPFAEPLIFMPGAFTLSFEADGYQPKDVAIKVEAGSEAERKIELEPIKIVVTPPGPSEGGATAEVTPEAPSKIPLYLGGGVTVAALGVGVVAGILAVGLHKTFVAADSTRNQREDARATGKNDALLSDVMLGTAVVAAGFTAYWYVFKYKRGAKTAGETPTSPNAPEMSKLDLAPWVQHDAGGLTVMGAF